MKAHLSTTKFVVFSLLQLLIASHCSAQNLIETSGNNSDDFTGNGPWTIVNTNGFEIGSNGIGSLTVQNGGQVFNNNSGSNSSGNASIGNDPGSTGTARISGLSSRWENDRWLVVGRQGTGNLEVFSGATVTSVSNAWLGFSIGAHGSVDVHSGGQWNHSGAMFIGQSGSGILNLSSGGRVTSSSFATIGNGPTSSGVATVTGVGSEWTMTGNLNVGLDGDGELNVLDGGFVKSEAGTIGNTFSSLTDGVVNVSGVGSHWDNSAGELNVGRFGNGELNISNGGLVTNADGHVARQRSSSDLSSGSVNITGAGSHWNNTGSLFVGIFGHGDVSVQDGALLSSNSGIVGLNGGSTGSVTIEGGSNWNNSGDLFTGFFGDGTVNIESGSSVSNVNAFIGVATSGNNAGNGVVNVTGQGSAWNNSGDVSVGGDQFGVAGSGLVSISDNALVFVDGTMKLYQPGTVNLSGGKLEVGILDLTELDATENFNMTGGRLVVDSILGSFKQEGGTLAPGDSPGLTSIQDDYDMLAGTVEFELAGLSRGTEYDALDIGGNATLMGTIDIDFINGFIASEGDSFQLIDFGGILSGSPFFDFSDATLSSGLTWDTSLFASGGSISVVSSVPEPTTTVLFGFAFAYLSVSRRRRPTGK